MAAIYTVLIPPTRVTEDEANFVNEYRKANWITVGETLRRCVNALRENGQDFKRMPYGLSRKMLPGFLVDTDTNNFITGLVHEKDTSRCQIIRSAIDCMKKKQEVNA